MPSEKLTIQHECKQTRKKNEIEIGFISTDIISNRVNSPWSDHETIYNVYDSNTTLHSNNSRRMAEKIFDSNENIELVFQCYTAVISRYKLYCMYTSSISSWMQCPMRNAIFCFWSIFTLVLVIDSTCIPCYAIFFFYRLFVHFCFSMWWKSFRFILNDRLTRNSKHCEIAVLRYQTPNSFASLFSSLFSSFSCPNERRIDVFLVSINSTYCMAVLLQTTLVRWCRGLALFFHSILFQNYTEKKTLDYTGNTSRIRYSVMTVPSLVCSYCISQYDTFAIYYTLTLAPSLARRQI